MVDTLTTRERSHRMSLIRSKDTKPELKVRSLLHAMGYRFRLHRNDLPGRPDISFGTRKKIIFVHGCFWHGHDHCSVANVPKSRTDFWNQKFLKNRERDRRNIDLLKDAGWEVLVVWECEAKAMEDLAKRLAAFLGPTKMA